MTWFWRTVAAVAGAIEAWLSRRIDRLRERIDEAEMRRDAAAREADAALAASAIRHDGQVAQVDFLEQAPAERLQRLRETMAHRGSYKTLVVGLAVAASLGGVGCGCASRAAVAPSARFDVPPRPALPAVEFMKPGERGAVLCLDQDNADHLAIGEAALHTHIRALEALITHCR